MMIDLLMKITIGFASPGGTRGIIGRRRTAGI